jgi:hypothetical protein
VRKFLAEQKQYLCPDTKSSEIKFDSAISLEA